VSEGASGRTSGRGNELAAREHHGVPPYAGIMTRGVWTSWKNVIERGAPMRDDATCSGPAPDA
jgi:hypothetical protein